LRQNPRIAAGDTTIARPTAVIGKQNTLQSIIGKCPPERHSLALESVGLQTMEHIDVVKRIFIEVQAEEISVSLGK
jgi:hypothetical protein